MLKTMRNALMGLVALGLGLFATAAKAIESAYATQAGAAVTGAQADMTYVWGLVLTLVVAIWAIYKIVKIFGGK